jgi:hypothetical protein
MFRFTHRNPVSGRCCIPNHWVGYTCTGHLKIRGTYQILVFTYTIHFSVTKIFKLRPDPLLTLLTEQSAYNDDPIVCT